MNITIIAIIMVISELLGAVICLKTKDTFKRMLLTCIGLGFAYAVVLLDILPDATEHYAYGFLICAAGAFVIYLIDRYGRHIGGPAAVLGMGFHDFCEGAVLTVLGSTASPLVIVAFILHKFPEGIISFSLLDGLRDKMRFFIVLLISLLIPLGTFMPIPEHVEQPILAFIAGVILFVISKSLVMLVSEHRCERPKIAVATAIGAILGVIPCLIIM